MRATILKTSNPSIIKIKCFLKKKSGLENLVAAKSTVDEATIIKPINIRLVTHAKKSKSRPLVSKKSMTFLILLASILYYEFFKMITTMLIIIICIIA